MAENHENIEQRLRRERNEERERVARRDQDLKRIRAERDGLKADLVRIRKERDNLDGDVKIFMNRLHEAEKKLKSIQPASEIKAVCASCNKQYKEKVNFCTCGYRFKNEKNKFLKFFEKC